MKALSLTQGFGARTLAAIALFSLVAGLVPMQAFAVDNGKPTKCEKDFHLEGEICVADLNPNVTICHANSGQNLYNNQSVDSKSIVNLPNGHKDHDKGGLDDMGDIIPSFTYNFGEGQMVYPGKNLTTVYSGGLSGQQILNNNCVIPETTGTLTVVKEVKNDNGGTKVVSNFPLFINLGAGSPISVTSGVAKTNLTPGTYTVSETQDSNYTASFSASCPNGVISLAAGESKTCTITNDDKVIAQDTGTIVIVKNTVGGNGTFNFTSQTLGAFQLTTTNGTASQTFSNKNVGPYDVSETIPAGWDLTSATCSDQSPINGVSLQANETVTCTFTNTVEGGKTGILRIIKNVIGKIVTDYSIFSFMVDGSRTATSFTAVSGQNDVVAAVGPHSVLESVATGYTTAYSPECTSAQIAEGQTTTCTITNTWIATCSDGIQNQNETAVDVGGPCPGPVVCDDDSATNFGQEGRCTYNYPSECINPTNLLSNGSFEEPAISQSWERSLITGWSVTKVSDGSASPLGEIWRGLVTPSHLLQNLELDGDYPTKITQTSATIPGATYELRFDFSARSGYGVADNSIISATGGLPLTSVATANTNWTTYGATFVATTTATNISLADAGTANSYGTLLDNAVLCLVREPAPVDFCPNIEATQSANDGYLKDVNGQCYIPITSCSVNVVSDTSNTVNAAPALLVTPNPAWVATIPSSLAKWIWGTSPNLPIDPVVDEVQTFKKSFVWSGTPSTAMLKISSDNGYSVKLNGVVVGSDADEFNYQSLDTIINLTDDIIVGVNTLEISVTNKANGQTLWSSNPGGLMYDLTITNTTGNCAPDGDDGGGNNEDDLSCTITVDNSPIRRGRDVNVTWDSTNAVSAMLNGESVALDGTQLFENLREDTTYTLTIMDENEQTDSCTVSVDTRSGGGGGGNSAGDRDDDQDGEVLGDSDDLDDAPAGEVLGDQVSAVPVGAPNAGQGGTSPFAQTPFGIVPVAFVRRSRHG